MARGNDRGAIFRLNSDRVRFIEKLGESAQTYHVRVYAYALMKNHWHGLIETPRGNLEFHVGAALAPASACAPSLSVRPAPLATRPPVRVAASAPAPITVNVMARTSGFQ